MSEMPVLVAVQNILGNRAASRYRPIRYDVTVTGAGRVTSMAAAVLAGRVHAAPHRPGHRASLVGVITCVVHYVIDPAKIEAFERFGRRWMELVDRHGGTHHGYFLPAEGASDLALALFSFPGLAAYEEYRTLFGRDPEFIEVDRIRDESGCVLRYERTFMRPLLPGTAQPGL
jgi:hypothetical protein